MDHLLDQYSSLKQEDSNVSVAHEVGKFGFKERAEELTSQNDSWAFRLCNSISSHQDVFSENRRALAGQRIQELEKGSNVLRNKCLRREKQHSGFQIFEK
jgi:hypothetical protein